MSGGACALALMVKAPRPGAVKTRLVPPLTAEEAAALSASLLRDTAESLLEAAAATGARATAIYAPVDAGADLARLLPPAFTFLPQRGDDLTARLQHAAVDLTAAGFASFCLVNADSPTLPPAILIAAVEALARPGARAVIAPAEDGGYCVIGLERPAPRLFEGIDWSTDRVCAQTLDRAAELGLPVELLPAWYDVDDAAALRRLRDDLLGAGPPLHGLLPHPAAHSRRFLTGLVAAGAGPRLWPPADGPAGPSI